MKTKLNYMVSILVITILVISGLVAAVNADKEVKIFEPSKSLIDKGNTKNLIAGKGVLKRVIADKINEEDIKLFKNKGCLIKHRLKDSASFECPEEVTPELKAREARIFHILDLEADKQIKADQVWNEGINGEGVNVVILDTGIDSSHVELSDSIKGQKDFVNNDDIAEDDNGHGTHVAGIITANGVYSVDSNYATGVAPGAGIYMLKVCDSSGTCYEDDMMAAMEYAADLNAKIMSISIGGGNFGSHCDSDPLATKVNLVVGNGIAVVAAAGNEGKGVSSPACASKAIAAGAVNKSGIVPYWSNRGTALDIIAPGVNILSTYSCLAAGDCGSYWYAKMSGTSMSTPHVSGVIALLLQTKPTATIDEIKNALYMTADPATKCYGCARWSGGKCARQTAVTCTPEIQGAGIVNAYKSYLAIKPLEPKCTADADCDDGLYCNGAETCQAGVCQAGQAVDCSALTDQCNNGICDETKKQCAVSSKADGTSCDDGLFCNIGETCQAGVCTPGKAYTCDDSNSCTTDSCNEDLNKCENIAAGDGTSCAGGICCVGRCSAPVCSADTNCNDNKACTIDRCNNGGTCSASCSYTAVTACTNNDGCCPAGCNYNNDNDCPTKVKCWSAGYNYLYKNNNQAKKFCKCAQGTYGYKKYNFVSGTKTTYQYIDTGDNGNWAVSSRSSYNPVYQVRCTNGNWYNTNQDYYFG